MLSMLASSSLVISCLVFSRPPWSRCSLVLQCIILPSHLILSYLIVSRIVQLGGPYGGAGAPGVGKRDPKQPGAAQRASPGLPRLHGCGS